MATVERRVDVIEEVPNVADHNATDLILGNDSMHDQTERHQHPREIRGRENQDAQETQACLGIASAPYVDQTRGQGGAQERKRQERRDHQEGRHGVEEKP